MDPGRAGWRKRTRPANQTSQTNWTSQTRPTRPDQTRLMPCQIFATDQTRLTIPWLRPSLRDFGEARTPISPPPRLRRGDDDDAYDLRRSRGGPGLLQGPRRTSVSIRFQPRRRAGPPRARKPRSSRFEFRTSATTTTITTTTTTTTRTKSRIEGRGARIEERVSRVEDRGSRIESRGSRSEDRGSRLCCVVSWLYFCLTVALCSVLLPHSRVALLCPPRAIVTWRVCTTSGRCTTKHGSSSDPDAFANASH